MGLLGRRHTNNQIPTIGKTNDQQSQPSESSLRAAQAAASLFQNTNSSQTTQIVPSPQLAVEKKPSIGVRRSSSVSVVTHPSGKRVSTTTQIHKPSAPQASAPKQQPTATQHVTNPPAPVISTPKAQSIVQHSAPQSRSRTPVPDPVAMRSPTPVESKPRLIRTRSKSPQPPALNQRYGTPPETPQPSQITIQSIASAAAKSAANSTSELLAPPPQAHINRVYPSSPSISLGSSNSIDSAPFSLKPPNFTPNYYRSDSEGTNNSHSFDVPHINNATSPRFFFDSDQNFSDLEINDRNSVRSSSAGSEFFSLAPKSLRASGGSSTHLALDTIPSRIDENEYEYESEPDEDDNCGVEDDSDFGGVLPRESRSQIEFTETVFDTDGSSTALSKSNRVGRKPPPIDSPPFIPHTSSYSGATTLHPNHQPPMIRRNTSPRRKPPPGSLQPDLDPIDPGDYSREEEDEDSLPQYPLSAEDQERRRRHRHHHGFRKHAKNYFKKGLKSATAASSNSSGHILKDDEPKPVHFKTTMRKEKKSTVFNEDKPWKHHNDREYITEQERKRYDGLWVANKGIYMELVDAKSLNEDLDSPDHQNSTALRASRLSTNSEAPPVGANLMVNLVVKDIWARSRLPPDTLRQIWDLVDTNKDGTLSRKSFIIGMWLVDQCLYGRKLPKVLDDSVWNSVSQLGVNVVIKPKKR